MSAPHGPFNDEAEARAAAHAVIAPEDGHYVLSPAQNRQLLGRALEAAGVECGRYDDRIIEWLGGLEDAICAAVASWVTRAAAGTPGPHAVTFDLITGDETYWVLTGALGQWAAEQRHKAANEGRNDDRERWAATADRLLGAVEDAMDGES